MKISIVLLLMIISVANLSAQNSIIAEAGKEKISEKEFIYRFEFTPKTNFNEPKDSAKINFLFSLIAEKLWAQEGEKLGFANSVYVSA